MLSRATAINLSAFPLLTICGFAFASKVILSKGALSAGMQPIQLGIFGNLGAGLLLLPALMKSEGNIPHRRQDLILYLTLGIISFAVPTVLSYFVVQKVGPAYTSTIYSLSPLLTMAFAAGLGVEKMSMRRFAAIIIGFAGMLLLIQQQLIEMKIQDPAWVMLGLIIPVCAAIGNIIRSTYWPKDASAMAFSCGMLFSSGLILAIVSPFLDTPSQWTFFRLDIVIWLAVLIGISALSSVLNFQLQRIGGPVVFSQLGYWGTGFGVLLSALIFGDVLTVVALLGVGLIISGGFLSRKK